VAQLRGGAPTKTAPKSTSSESKQLKDKDVAGLYQDMIMSTIANLNASLKKPARPYVSVLMNGHRLSALY